MCVYTYIICILNYVYTHIIDTQLYTRMYTSMCTCSYDMCECIHLYTWTLHISIPFCIIP